jgi:hypothetical protein
MDTLEYFLKSKPGKSVHVPADYALIAEDIVTSVVQGRAGPAELVERFAALRNPGVLARTAKLAITEPADKNYNRLFDEVYLRICVYGLNNPLSGPERHGNNMLEDSIIRTIESL